MKKIYKAVIIGTGRIGFSLQFDKKREQPASHSLALSKNKSIKLAAACDIDNSKLDKWKSFYRNTNIYNDILKMLETEKPDIVTIAVNEESHLETALKVIQHKPQLLILEKPVSANLKDAKLIKLFAEKYNVPVCINHERRFALDYNIAKKLISEGKLGEINSVRASLWSGAAVYKKNVEKTGACSLIHDGTHLVDIIHYLFDIELKKVSIDNIVYNNKKEVRTLNVHYNKKLKKGSCDTIFYFEFCGMKNYFGFEVEISGTKGRIIIGNGYLKYYESKVSPYYTGFYSLVRNKTIKTFKKTHYFSNMISNCVNFLTGKEKLLSSLDDGINVLRVLYNIITRINKSK